MDYTATFQINPSQFDGPLVVEPPSDVPYGFEWRYSDAVGRVSFFVWVESSGWSYVAIDGDIERLKADPKAPVRARAKPPSNKRLQLTPNSSFQSIRGSVLAAGAAPQRRRSALLGAAEPHVR